MKLLLIRHAIAAGNAEKRMLGQLDVPLTLEGQQQAQQLGQFLHAYSWQPTHLYCSPLQRAVQTLRILRDCNNKPISTLPIQRSTALLEINTGVLQGLTWSEAEEQQPDLCEALLSSQEWIAVPGGESRQACCDRTHQFIQTLYTQHQNSDRLWVITHGGILPYLIAAILDTPQVWEIKTLNTALFEFELDLDHLHKSDGVQSNLALCQILQFNDRPHLSSEGSS